MILSASLAIMGEALKNPERLTKSDYLIANDPNTVKTELSKAMEITKNKLSRYLFIQKMYIYFV